MPLDATPTEVPILDDSLQNIREFVHVMRTTTLPQRRRNYFDGINYCALGAYQKERYNFVSGGNRILEDFGISFFAEILHLNDAEGKTYKEIADIVERKYLSEDLRYSTNHPKLD